MVEKCVRIKDGKMQQSKQRAQGASCESEEWTWQQLLQDACQH